MIVDKASTLELKLIKLNDEGRFYELTDNGNVLGRWAHIGRAHAAFIRHGRERGVLVAGETPAGLHSEEGTFSA